MDPADILPTLPAHVFFDPPYLYNYRYRKSLGEFDFEKFAETVNGVSGLSRVVVCEAARKTDGAIPDYLPFLETHRSVTSRRKATQSHHSKEVTYVREPVDFHMEEC